MICLLLFSPRVTSEMQESERLQAAVGECQIFYAVFYSIIHKKRNTIITLDACFLQCIAIELDVYIAQGLPNPLVDDRGALASLVESCLIVSNADSSTFFSLLRPRM